MQPESLIRCLLFAQPHAPTPVAGYTFIAQTKPLLQGDSCYSPSLLQKNWWRDPAADYVCGAWDSLYRTRDRTSVLSLFTRSTILGLPPRKRKRVSSRSFALAWCQIQKGRACQDRLGSYWRVTIYILSGNMFWAKLKNAEIFNIGWAMTSRPRLGWCPNNALYNYTSYRMANVNNPTSIVSAITQLGCKIVFQKLGVIEIKAFIKIQSSLATGG